MTRVFLILMLMLSTDLYADTALSDGDTSIDTERLAELISLWEPRKKELALENADDLADYLALEIELQKRTSAFEALEPKRDDLNYLRALWQLDRLKRELLKEYYTLNLVIPDMTAVAQERYDATPEKWAEVPEVRLSSHILFKCEECDANCSNDVLMEQAKEVHAQLLEGADFKKFVAEYSKDPGSRKRGGRLTTRMTAKQKNVLPEYLDALFAIEEGQKYSEPFVSQYGIHIIRLDKVVEKHNKPFDAVKSVMIDELEKEFVEMSLEKWSEQFRPNKPLEYDPEFVRALVKSSLDVK